MYKHLIFILSTCIYEYIHVHVVDSNKRNSKRFRRSCCRCKRSQKNSITAREGSFVWKIERKISKSSSNKLLYMPYSICVLCMCTQAKLNDCEQQFLEKELLLEQVTRLLDRTEKKANGRKETTFQVGNKVNHYQSKLREVTRKMMSLISELSVQQVHCTCIYVYNISTMEPLKFLIKDTWDHLL